MTRKESIIQAHRELEGQYRSDTWDVMALTYYVPYWSRCPSCNWKQKSYAIQQAILTKTMDKPVDRFVSPHKILTSDGPAY